MSEALPPLRPFALLPLEPLGHPLMSIENVIDPSGKGLMCLDMTIGASTGKFSTQCSISKVVHQSNTPMLPQLPQMPRKRAHLCCTQ